MSNRESTGKPKLELLSLHYLASSLTQWYDEEVQQVLAPYGWQINTAFIERINLSMRQHVAAIGRRVSTLCKGEEGLRQQLTLYHVYHNFCLPHVSLRQALACS